MAREVVLDTETTGLSPLQGHRVVEIGCVELVNHLPTGQVYHVYINPERDMPPEASRVHGLTDDFLSSKPVFSSIAGDFTDFIADVPLVIHNATFDMGFLNAELSRIGFPALEASRAIDTMTMARRKFPGAPATLDALCKRFGVDLSERTMHGALLDARLLADVYLELRGGRQPDLNIIQTAMAQEESQEGVIRRERREPRNHQPNDDELAQHEEFLRSLKSPLWKRG